MDDLYKAMPSYTFQTLQQTAVEHKEQISKVAVWPGYILSETFCEVSPMNTAHTTSHKIVINSCIPRHSQLVEELYLESIFN